EGTALDRDAGEDGGGGAGVELDGVAPAIPLGDERAATEEDVHRGQETVFERLQARSGRQAGSAARRGEQRAEGGQHGSLLVWFRDGGVNSPRTPERARRDSIFPPSGVSSHCPTQTTSRTGTAPSAITRYSLRCIHFRSPVRTSHGSSQFSSRVL